MTITITLNTLQREDINEAIRFLEGLLDAPEPDYQEAAADYEPAPYTEPAQNPEPPKPEIKHLDIPQIDFPEGELEEDMKDWYIEALVSFGLDITKVYGKNILKRSKSKFGHSLSETPTDKIKEVYENLVAEVKKCQNTVS